MLLCHHTIEQLKNHDDHAGIIELLEPLWQTGELTLPHQLTFANALLAAQRLPLAKQVYQTILSQNSTHPWATIGLANTLASLENNESALAFLNEQIEQGNHHENVLALKVQWLWQAKSYQQASLYASSLSEALQNTVPILLQKGHIHFHQKEYALAQPFYAQVLAQMPTHVGAALHLMEVALLTHKPHEAITFGLQWLANAPQSNLHVTRKLARSYLLTQQYDSALAQLQQIEHTVWGKLGILECLVESKADPQKALACLKAHWSTFVGCQDVSVFASLANLCEHRAERPIQEQFLQLLTECDGNLPLPMLMSAIRISHKFGQAAHLPSLFAQLVTCSPLTYPQLKTALDIASHHQDSQSIEGLLAHANHALPESDRQLLEYQRVYEQSGAMLAVRLLSMRPNFPLEDYIDTLIPMFIHAGKIQALAERAANQGNLAVHTQITLHLKCKNFQQALKLIYSEQENKRDNTLYLAPLCEIYYQQGKLERCLQTLTQPYLSGSFPYLESLVIFCLVEVGIDLNDPLHAALIHAIQDRVKREGTPSLHTRILDEVCLSMSMASSEKSLRFYQAIQQVMALYQYQRSLIPVTPLIFLGGKRNNWIPNHIVQYWDSATLPDYVLDATNTWRTQEHFEYQLFCKRKAMAYIHTHFTPEHARAFSLCQHSAEQADYFRLCYLAKQGGWYADTDDVRSGDLMQIRRLLPSECRLAVIKDPYGIGNNVIIASPQHPVILAALERATQSLLKRTQDMIWMKTGPGLLIQCLGEYLHWLHQQQQPVDVRILSPENYHLAVQTHTQLPYKNSSKNWTRFVQPGAITLNSQ